MQELQVELGLCPTACWHLFHRKKEVGTDKLKNNALEAVIQIDDCFKRKVFAIFCRKG